MDMGSSEGQPQGRQRFGIARPEGVRGRGGTITAPEPPVRTKEDPTVEEAAAANAGSLLSRPENAILAFAKKHPLATASSALAAVVTGFAAVEAAQGNIPGVHRSVNEPTPVNPVEFFNNKARSGEIETIKRIPEEEVAGLNSFARIDDHNTVQAIFPIDVSTSNKPDTKLKFTKRNTGTGNDQDRINRADQGYLNIYYIEKVPAGSTILAPVDGNLIVFMNPNLRKDATNDHPFFQAMIAFQPREGEEFRMQIGGRSTEGGMMDKRLDIFRSLTKAPVYDINKSPGERSEILKQAIPVKKGDPILQAAMDIDVSFSMGGDFDSGTRKETTLNNGTKVTMVQGQPTNLELFLSENGEIVQPQLSTN